MKYQCQFPAGYFSDFHLRVFNRFFKVALYLIRVVSSYVICEIVVHLLFKSLIEANVCRINDGVRNVHT